MEEDIDSYEPDMNSYYSMDEEEKKLRNQKYYLWKKYYDGKITYEKYIKVLEGNFIQILDSDEFEEIKNFKIDQKKKAEIEQSRKNIELFKKRKEREELNDSIGCIVWIIILIASLIVISTTD